MAKRFTDSDKWTDGWFRRLNPEQKIFWFYLLDNCDAAGVWEVDWELFSTLSRVPQVEIDALLKGFESALVFLPGGRKIWVRRFVEYQYGRLSEGCKPHCHVIALLKKHTLWKEYTDGFETVQEKEKDKEKDKERKGGVGEKQSRKTPPAYPPEVYRVYDFYHGLLKASARKADALRWIDRRGSEVGFDRLVMAINAYKIDCKKKNIEEKFFKDCANFFGEDAAYEGFLPDDSTYEKLLPKAQEVLKEVEIAETKAART